MKPQTYAEHLAKLMDWPLDRAAESLRLAAKDGMCPQYIVQCAGNGLKAEKKRLREARAAAPKP